MVAQSKKYWPGNLHTLQVAGAAKKKKKKEEEEEEDTHTQKLCCSISFS